MREFARLYELATLVETGTYYGDMVQATKRSFANIYSIELSNDLACRAKRRFASDRNVSILQGDSGVVLTRILPSLSKPALFWLDAHYSGGITGGAESDSPILEELTQILSPGAPLHIILIDDARLFGIENGYPTMDALADIVRARAPQYALAVRDDCIFILPKATMSE